MNINRREYLNKVRGCWLGKNIGGTFGAPYEGKPEMNDAITYTNIVPGQPLPNDDLDLQLVWLFMVEEEGIERITPRLCGEYWLCNISGPWNEYGVCRANIANGFYPPLSGSAGNRQWHWSNGAWIRSEIWACLAPGAPDAAIRLAYCDACCDHDGEGIYAELFTAAMESAAFVVKDIRELIRIGLAKIPPDCRIARAVKCACDAYDRGLELKAARAAILEDSRDLGMFQGPANLGFVTLGLLYGEGDFSKSLRYAVNCGDDTDCTGATVGAILGIIYGVDAIPKEWIEPIGESIQTIAINPVNVAVPRTIAELTDRVANCALAASRQWRRSLLSLTDAPTDVGGIVLDDPEEAEKIWRRSSNELVFDLPWGEFAVDYDGGPEFTPGIPKKITLLCRSTRIIAGSLQFSFELPEGWSMNPGSSGLMMARLGNETALPVELTAGNFGAEANRYLPLTLRATERPPAVLMIPVRLAGAIELSTRGGRSFRLDGTPEPLYTVWRDHVREKTASRVKRAFEE